MTSKRFVLLLILLLSMALVACGGGGAAEPEAADTGAETEGGVTTELPDLGGREITVTLENAYLPFNYIDPATGEPAGWDYEAIGAICELLNCVPTFVESQWEGMIQAVADGQFDMAADGITITDERKELVDFSDGFINIEQRLMARIDEERFDSVDSFIANEELIIGTQTGTTNFETISELVAPERIQAFDSFPFAVQSLLSGDVDAVIIDETAGLGYQGANADQLKLVGDSLSSDELGFVFPKGSDLVEPFNLAMAELRANGKMDRLAEKYFTDAFTVTYEDLE